jgi:polyhydroxybutyrate depolymerase
MTPFSTKQRLAIATAIIAMLAVAMFAGTAFKRFELAASDSPESTAPGPGATSGALEFGGLKRTYFVHVPTGYDGIKPLPLVFVLHGGGQSPESAERMSGMSVKADIENFLAVYPSGTGRLSSMPTWNSGACCGYAMEHHVDDVGFLRALIGKLESDYTVDPNRIYFTGISNGAMMSYRAACEMADEVAAIAPVEGAQDIDCRPSAPVSVIVFHGTADNLVPFNGGSTPYQIGSKRTDRPVADTIGFWVKQDGCAPKPSHEETKEVHLDNYSACDGGAAVTLYAIQGGRHVWPGARVSGNHVPATDLIWSFFAAHPKP